MLQTQNPQKKTQQHTVCAGALCVVRFHEISSCFVLSHCKDRTSSCTCASHAATSRLNKMSCASTSPCLDATGGMDLLFTPVWD